MPADPTDTLTLTTRPDHLAAACERTEKDDLRESDEIDCVSIFRFEVASRPGITIEQAAAHAADVAARFPCSIGFRFAGTTVLVAPYQNPGSIVKNWKATVEADRNPRPTEADRQTAIDGDAQRRHGRQQRLILAATDVMRWMSPSTDGIRGLRDRLKDALAEFADSDTGPVAVETEAERDNERLREEVAVLSERLETRIKMTDQLHCVCDDHERAIAERNTTIEVLRGEVELKDKVIGSLDGENTRLAQEIAALRAQVNCEAAAAETILAQKDKRDAVIADLRAQLAASQAREAETAKRCEAVFKAVDELASVWSEAAWGKVRQAVDALRPAKATEVRA